MKAPEGRIQPGPVAIAGIELVAQNWLGVVVVCSCVQRNPGRILSVLARLRASCCVRLCRVRGCSACVPGAGAVQLCAMQLCVCAVQGYLASGFVSREA